MNKLSTVVSITIILISSVTEARMNKCIVNGKTIYQDKQCASNSTASVSMKRKWSSEVNQADSIAAQIRVQEAKQWQTEFLDDNRKARAERNRQAEMRDRIDTMKSEYKEKVKKAKKEKESNSRSKPSRQTNTAQQELKGYKSKVFVKNELHGLSEEEQIEAHKIRYDVAPSD